MFVVSQSSDENAQTCARDHTNRANLRKAFAFADFGKRREAVEYPRCHRLFLSLDRATAVDRYPSGCRRHGAARGRSGRLPHSNLIRLAGGADSCLETRAADQRKR